MLYILRNWGCLRTKFFSAYYTTFGIIGTVFAQQIVDLSGARKLGDEMRRMSADYLFYYSAFSMPMLMSNCLSVFVRNDGSPALSFIGMCTGGSIQYFP